MVPRLIERGEGWKPIGVPIYPTDKLDTWVEQTVESLELTPHQALALTRQAPDIFADVQRHHESLDKYTRIYGHAHYTLRFSGDHFYAECTHDAKYVVNLETGSAHVRHHATHHTRVGKILNEHHRE